MNKIKKESLPQDSPEEQTMSNINTESPPLDSGEEQPAANLKKESQPLDSGEEQKIRNVNRELMSPYPLFGLDQVSTRRLTRSERKYVYLTFRKIFTDPMERNGHGADDILNHLQVTMPESKRAFRIGQLALLYEMISADIFEGNNAKSMFPELFGEDGEFRGDLRNDNTLKDKEELQAPGDVESKGSDEAAEKASHGPSYPEITSVYKEAASSDPSYFTFDAQHNLLLTLQTLLEKSLFEFAQKWMPEELERRGLNDPSAAGHSKWQFIFSKAIKSGGLPFEALVENPEVFQTRLLSAYQIRNHAEYNEVLSVVNLQNLVADLLSLMMLLRDKPRADHLQVLLDGLIPISATIEQDKSHLEENIEMARKEKEALQPHIQGLEQQLLILKQQQQMAEQRMVRDEKALQAAGPTPDKEDVRRAFEALVKEAFAQTPMNSPEIPAVAIEKEATPDPIPAGLPEPRRAKRRATAKPDGEKRTPKRKNQDNGEAKMETPDSSEAARRGPNPPRRAKKPVKYYL